MKNRLTFVVAAMALSACDGGSDLDLVNTGDPELDALVVVGQSVINAFDGFEATDTFSPYAGRPEDGDLVYTGVALYGEGTIDDMDQETLTYAAMGAFVATASFDGAETVSGTVDNLFEVSNVEAANAENPSLANIQTTGPIEGSFAVELNIQQDGLLTIANGNWNGSLTKADGTSAGFLNADAAGAFLGDEFEVLEVTGGVVTDTTFQGITAIGVN